MTDTGAGPETPARAGAQAAYGLSLAADAGWVATIYRRVADVPGETTHPVLHACTRALPAERGDFGVGVVELLGPDDVFVAVVEYDPLLAGRGLFARQGRPRLAPSQFAPNRLQRVVPGRSAAQHFYTDGGRAFCLFVVLGAHSRRMALVPKAARLVAGLHVTELSALQPQGATR
jgi:hypothetical protein